MCLAEKEKKTTTRSSMLISESLSYHSDETMSFNGLVEKERKKLSLALREK